MRRTMAGLAFAGSTVLLASCGGGGTGASDATLLRGTWDAPLAGADAQWVRDGLASEGLIDRGDHQVAVRLGLDGTTWWQGFVFDGKLILLNGVPEGDGGRLDVAGDTVFMTGADGGARITYDWTLDGNTLTLAVTEQCDVSASATTCTSDRSKMDADMLRVTEHTYTRSGDDATY